MAARPAFQRFRSEERRTIGILALVQADETHRQLQAVEVRSPADFDTAFSHMTKARTVAPTVLGTTMFFNERRRLAGLAVKNRLPAVYSTREFVDAGGLMAYGANLADLFRRAATYVDKILREAKPADLRVEQPSKFEFVINLKTAKALGVTITPPSSAQWEAFIAGLRERGCVEGQNIVLERRYSEGREDRFPGYAAEFVQMKVDMVLVQSTQAALAAKAATSSIPIGMVGIFDPDRTGLVASLGRPGGNVTGISNFNLKTAKALGLTIPPSLLGRADEVVQ